MGFTVLPEAHNHIMYPFIFVCFLIFVITGSSD